MRGEPSLVVRDAFRSFEERFGVPALGAISPSDAEPPSPARLAALLGEAAARGVACVLAEPGADPGLAAAGGARVVAADPLGSAVEPGPELYPQLLRELGRDAADYLTS